MPGKKGKGGGDGGNKKNEPSKPTGGEGGAKPTGGSDFKFNFGGEGGTDTRAPTFDFGGKDSPLVPIMQKKLNTLIGKDSGYFETLPAPVQNRIRGLKALHNQKGQLDKQYKKELTELQAKFEKLTAPLYERRREIVNGSVEPTKEELEEAAKLEAEAAKEQTAEGAKEVKKEKKEEGAKSDNKEEEEEVDVKGIPNFWLNAFLHHGDFAESITKQDEKALKYLVDVRWKHLPEEKGRSESSFVLEFEFSENPYFTNKVLTKTYYLTEHELLGETMFDRMEGCDIDWKAGKNLTVKLVQIQQNVGRRGGGRKGRGGKGKGGPGKTITVEEPSESFFNFFNSDVSSAFMIDEEEKEDVDLQELYEVDYEMGVGVKEQIIPSAVLWFTGEIEDPWGDDDDSEGEDGEYDSAEDPDFEPDTQAPLPGGQKPECAQQ